MIRIFMKLSSTLCHVPADVPTFHNNTEADNAGLAEHYDGEWIALRLCSAEKQHYGILDIIGAVP